MKYGIICHIKPTAIVFSVLDISRERGFEVLQSFNYLAEGKRNKKTIPSQFIQKLLPYRQ